MKDRDDAFIKYTILSIYQFVLQLRVFNVIVLSPLPTFTFQKAKSFLICVHNFPFQIDFTSSTSL